MTRGGASDVEPREEDDRPQERDHRAAETAGWVALVPAGLCLAAVVILILMRFID